MIFKINNVISLDDDFYDDNSSAFREKVNESEQSKFNDRNNANKKLLNE